MKPSPYLLLPPLEPLLELPAPAPALEPASPAAPPLDPPFWPWALLSAAAPVCLVFFFDLCLPDALLSAEPAADASCVAVVSFAAVRIEPDVDDVLSLMLEVLPLFDDLDLLDLLDLSTLVSLGRELVLVSAAVPEAEAPLSIFAEPLPIEEALLPE